MLSKTLAMLAFGAGGFFGGAMIGVEGGLVLGAAAAAVVLVFRRLIRRLLLAALVLGSLGIKFGYLSPPG
jgi:hypothetical protein